MKVGNTILLIIILIAPGGASPDIDQDILSSGSLIPETEIFRASDMIPMNAENGSGNALRTGIFVENRGQWEENVLYSMETSLGRSIICRDGLYIDVRGEDGGNVLKYGSPEISAEDIERGDPLPGTYNYFLGNDESKWVTEARSFREITVKDIWEGIDGRFYSSEGLLKYDLICREGSDPGMIRFDLEGVDSLSMERGELLIELESGQVINDGGLKVFDVSGAPLKARYDPVDEDSFGFKVEQEYDGEITIDPIIYGTYIGGSTSEAYDMDTDRNGCRYVLGSCLSADLMTTPGAYQQRAKGVQEGFIAKFDGADSDLVYCTYIGGSYIDYTLALDVDDPGCAYFTGYTYSDDFPVTKGSLNHTPENISDTFVVKLSRDGTFLEYSLMYGGNGSEVGRDILVKDSGEVIIFGDTSSTDLPMTNRSYRAAYSRNTDLFLARFDPTGSRLEYASYFGWTNVESAAVIEEGPDGILYLGGYTLSYKFPISESCFDHTFTGGVEGFVIRFEERSDHPYRATLIGGTGNEYVKGIEYTDDRCVIIGGETNSWDLWPTEGVYQSNLSGGYDLFLTKLDENLTRAVYSTYVGSPGNETLSRMTLDSSGNIHCLGETDSNEFPTTWGVVKNILQGDSEGICFIMEDGGANLTYSTYVGGFMEDHPKGFSLGGNSTVYICGSTGSDNFPPRDIPGFDKTLDGWGEGFLITLDRSLPPSPPRDLGLKWWVGWVNISWNPPIQDNGHPVLDYLVEKDTGAGFFRVGRTTKLHLNESWTDLYDITGIVYRVSARSAAGYSNCTARMVFQSPMNFRYTVEFDRVELKWDRFSSNKIEIDGYLLRREHPGNLSNTMEVRIDSTFYSDPDVIKGETYNYSICALKGEYRSDRSRLTLDFVTVPGTPTGLLICSLNSTVSIGWERPSDNGGADLKGYHVYRGSGDHPLTYLDTVVNDTCSYLDNTTAYGINYTYRVAAANNAGASNLSEPVTILVLGRPDPPWNVSIITGVDQVEIQWTPPLTDGGSDIIRFDLYRMIDDRGWALFLPLRGNRSSFADRSVSIRTRYSYYLTAITPVGESDPSEIVSAVLEEKPSPPTSLRSVPGPGHVTIHWSPPTYTGHSQLTGYRVYRRTETTDHILMEEVGASRSFMIDEDIDLGSVYHYRVTALNMIGESGPSAEMEYIPVKPPSSPSNLRANAAASGIELNWFAPVEDGGLPITRYYLFRGSGSDDMSLHVTLEGSKTGFIDKDVVLGQEYYYRVSCFNGIFNSTMSQAAKGVIRSVPGRIDDCRASLVNETIVIEWSPPESDGGAPIVYYEIYKRNTTGMFELMVRVSGNCSCYEDREIDHTGLYVYYIKARNEKGYGPDSIKFDAEVPSEFFMEEEEGIGAFTVLALVFLGLAVFLFFIAVFVHVRSRSRPNLPQPDVLPQPLEKAVPYHQGADYLDPGDTSVIGTGSGE